MIGPFGLKGNANALPIIKSDWGVEHYPDHYPGLGSDESLVLNFCPRFSDVICRETSNSVAKCRLFSQANLGAASQTLLTAIRLRLRRRLPAF